MVTNASQLVLSDLTAEVDDFVGQFNAYLVNQPVWKGELVTQTSQTLVELISSVGAFDQGRILRSYEDSFPETAQADDAVRAITTMQGLRISRWLPSELSATITSPATVTLPPYTQFTSGGTYLFNREQVVLNAGVPTPITLNQGYVKTILMYGDGSDFQAYVANEDPFVVADSDTNVRINGVLIQKSGGVLWNFRDQQAFADLTMPDGRLLVQFGNSRFGAVPGKTDEVAVTYVVTNGENTNNSTLSGKRVTVDGFSTISGTITSNPTGGASEKPVVVYKNVASGAFGTYESGVTKPQYVALVNTYPGIIDAVTQAQREINPMDLNWMNVIRVSALTTSPWTVSMKQDFMDAMQKITMYSCRFMWQDAIPMDRDVEVEVYFFNTAVLSNGQANSEAAIQNLLAPNPGILQTDFFESDIDTAIKKNNNSQVSYVKVIQPAEMIVNAPSSPPTTWALIPGGAAAPMNPGIYAYAVAVTNAQDAGPPNGWVFPQIEDIQGTNNAIQLTWPEVKGALSYRVYGRQGGNPSQPLGLMATITPNPANATATFVDNGTITPVGPLPSTMSLAPIRYNRLRNLTVRVYYADRQKRLDGSPERQEQG
jgi:hypothetical protein